MPKLLDYDIQDGENDYEVIATVDAQFDGTCCIDRDHKIKRKDRIGKVQLIENPFVVITGFACRHCTAVFPRAKRS